MKDKFVCIKEVKYFTKGDIYEFDYDEEMSLYLYNGVPLMNTKFNEHFVKLSEFRNNIIDEILKK
jgi:hypothetical protein